MRVALASARRGWQAALRPGFRFALRPLAATASRPPTAASETALGLLQQLQERTPEEASEGSVLSASDSVVRLSLPGNVAVGQGVEVDGVTYVVMRFDKKGVIAARLASGATPVVGAAARPCGSGQLVLKSLELPAGLSFATLQDVVRIQSEEVRPSEGDAMPSLLRLPSPPAPPQRRLVRHRLPSGLAAPEMLLPLGQGQRVGLVGPPGTGKSTALRMLAASQSSDTAVVFAALQARPRLQADLEALGLGTRSAPTLVLHANPAANPVAERYLLAVAALQAAAQLRAKHSHVLLAIDDVTGFAEAAADLGGAPPLSPVQVVAALLDAAGNVEVGGKESALSVAAVFDLSPDEELATTPRNLWRTAEPSLDVCLSFSRDLAAGGIFPAIDVDDLLAVSTFAPGYQAPLLAALREELRRLLQRSRELKAKLQMSKELGLQAELEDVEALGSDSVARAVLAHARPREPRELAVLVCASVLYYFPHTRAPPRSVVENFQRSVLESIQSGHPVLWEELGRLSDISREEAGPLLRELGEALLARRFEFQLTHPEL
eukprot:TRINITY_DN100427_c0_g1_i1.p1 TRINITY_DN100427_c0_g1~~TRINITY_DN100427_c0_g1_i1.p1  ORF type:complete len:568 (-),score=131.97 TRINITY_DN100427_c0_g1_i1:70-1719(-)